MYDIYTPIPHYLSVSDTGAIALSTTDPTTGIGLKITFGLLDLMDAGCKLDVSFLTRVGAPLTSGKPTAIKDIIAVLTFKDSDTGEKLYELSGLLAANGSAITLADAAADTGIFSVFTVALIGADAATADDIITSLAGNLPNTLGRNKVTVTMGATPGANETVPPSFYTGLVNTLAYGDVRANYLAIAKTDDLSLITALLQVVDKRNCMLFGDIDPTLSPDSAVAVSNGIEANDYRVAWYWNPTLARPRDALSIRGAKVARPVVGVILGYTLLRNANTNIVGIPPLQNPISGYNYPLPFKGIEMRSDIFADQAFVDKMADARINPVILHQGIGGSRYIFGDLLTQYEPTNSALNLVNSAEVAVYTANIVIDVTSRYLRTGQDDFHTFADRDIREQMDNCVAAGLLKPAEALNGKPYTLTIQPRVDRPFDAVQIDFARRPVGAVRAAYLTRTINK